MAASRSVGAVVRRPVGRDRSARTRGAVLLQKMERDPVQHRADLRIAGRLELRERLCLADEELIARVVRRSVRQEARQSAAHVLQHVQELRRRAAAHVVGMKVAGTVREKAIQRVPRDQPA